jgi:L,D-transpeptidase catalytic domain
MSAVNVRSIRAIILALLAICVVAPAGTARAQFLFWSQHGLWSSDYAWRRHEHRYRYKKPELVDKDQTPDAPKGPLQIIISIADQRVSVYDNGALIARSAVSTGVPRHPTPLGVFSVISKQRWHRSNLYSAAPMPYMQRITWSGIALHAGILPGHPASHGCIRLKDDFAIRLWRLTKPGARVIIASDDIRPVEIANPHLFESEPQEQTTPSPPQSHSDITGSAITIVPATHPPMRPNTDTRQVTDLQTPGSSRAADKLRNVVPISVFVSRKLSKVFVRRGFTPLFDIPLKIRDPEESLGTHVFTVIASQNEGAALRWTVVSMPEKSPRKHPAPKSRSSSKHGVEISVAVSSPDKANAALDRIEIPQDVVERISQLLTPGSSLIVSDYALSEETGSDTDFIVEMH